MAGPQPNPMQDLVPPRLAAPDNAAQQLVGLPDRPRDYPDENPQTRAFWRQRRAMDELRQAGRAELRRAREGAAVGGTSLVPLRGVIGDANTMGKIARRLYFPATSERGIGDYLTMKDRLEEQKQRIKDSRGIAVAFGGQPVQDFQWMEGAVGNVTVPIKKPKKFDFAYFVPVTGGGFVVFKP